MDLLNSNLTNLKVANSTMLSDKLKKIDLNGLNISDILKNDEGVEKNIIGNLDNSLNLKDDDIVIKYLDTSLDLPTISSIGNLLFYRETFPISSILYKKKGEKYIKESTKEEKKELFDINNILKEIKKKHTELKNNLEEKKKLMKNKKADASQSLLDDDKENKDTLEKRKIISQQQYWGLYMKIADFIIASGPAIIKFFSDNTGSSIKIFFSIFFGNWTNVFAGFVIVGSFIILVTILSSNKKSDNNKLSRRNSSSTTENNFTIQDYLSNSYDTFSSFTKRMTDNVTAVSETISSVTTATPDDITRIKLDNGRGADNLYHFNGKDLNKMNLKKGIYDENSVYSIYKPIDIKIKDFDIKWKSEKEENNNKYVFDCQDTSMKDYFDKDCTARTYDIIVTDKDNICVEPI
jgi:hypothetical protein